jgi:hypothetical protein
MSADIVPFPAVRQWAFVDKQANFVMLNAVDVGDRYVAAQLRRQANAMRGKGIAENLIARELRAMEFAIDTVVRRAHRCKYDMTGNRLTY